MTTKNYLLLCLVITVVLSLSLLFIPQFSDMVEQLMLLFLSTNAR
jgi:hypothetical protein